MEELNKVIKDDRRKSQYFPSRSKTVKIKYIRRSCVQDNINSMKNLNILLKNTSNFSDTLSNKNTIDNDHIFPKNQKLKLNLDITPHTNKNYFNPLNKKNPSTPAEIKKSNKLNKNISIFNNTIYTKSNNSNIKNSKNLTYNKTLKSFSSFTKNTKEKFPIIKHRKQLNYNSILNNFRVEAKTIFNKSIKRTKKDISDNIKKILEINKKSKHKMNKLKLDIIFNNVSKGNFSNKKSIFKQRQSSVLTKESNLINSESQKMFSIDSDDEEERRGRRRNILSFKNIYKNHKRRRSFNKYKEENYIFNPKWKKKVGIFENEMKYNSILSRGLKFQCNVIKDEMSLLIDDIYYYRFNVVNDSDINLAFKNKNIINQVSLNKIIEESCALLSLIPKILLKEYYIYSDRFISIEEPGPENYMTKIISNEMDCFTENLKLLYKIITYVKSSYEVYVQLVSKVEDEMILTPHNFNLILAIFQKTRYYMGHLINYTKNILKDYSFDKQLIAKCRPMIKKTEKEFQFDEKEKNFYDLERMASLENSEDVENIEKDKNDEKENQKTYKFSNQINFRENDLSQKILRITKALEINNELKASRNKISEQFRIKQAKISMKNSRIGPMALIFSPLMSEMLKYIKKDFRGKIISLRTTEKNYISSGTI